MLVPLPPLRTLYALDLGIHRVIKAKPPWITQDFSEYPASYQLLPVWVLMKTLTRRNHLVGQS
jgi:hypothetical protein